MAKDPAWKAYTFTDAALSHWESSQATTPEEKAEMRRQHQRRRQLSKREEKRTLEPGSGFAINHDWSG